MARDNDSISVSDGGAAGVGLVRVSFNAMGSRIRALAARAAWSLELPGYARTIRILLESRICCHHQHLGAHALEPLAQLRVFALLSIWAPELPNHTLCMFDTAD